MRRLFLAILGLALTSPCAASDWPQWRGPSFNGASDETSLPDSLDSQTLVWKTPLPGPSAATPIIADGCIYLTAGSKNDPNVTALCLNAADGLQKWSCTIPTRGPNRGQADVVSCSPVAYAGGAIFLFGEGTLLRVDGQGQIGWRHNLADEYGPLTHKFGFSSSPLLLEDRLYIPILRQQGGGASDLPSYLLCIDAQSGGLVFRRERPTDAVEEGKDAYTTPLATRVNGQTQIIVYGADEVTSHAPEDGRVLWRYCYGTEHNAIARLISSPSITGNTLVCVTPRGARTIALDLSKLKDGQPTLLWTSQVKGPDVPSPVCYQNCVYMIEEYQKTLICLNLQDGTTRWTGQLDKGDLYYASITAADGKLYVVNRDGTVTVVAADPRAFGVLSTTSFPQSPADSTVAVAGGKLYLRTAQNLYCFGRKD